MVRRAIRALHKRRQGYTSAAASPESRWRMYCANAGQVMAVLDRRDEGTGWALLAGHW